VEIGEDFMKERRHLFVEGELDQFRRKENISCLEGARGDCVEDRAVTALHETLDEVPGVAIEGERCDNF